MKTRFPAVLLVLAVALAACSGDTGTLDGGAPMAVSAQDAATGSGPPGDVTGTGGPTGASASPSGSARPAARASEEPAPFGGPTPGPAAHNTMPLDVTLSATCARPGDTMHATAETPPSSKLAFTAAYEEDDHGYVPDFHYVEDEMNPTGTYTWTWVIKPNIDPGEALVTVVAAKNDKGASFNAPFRVARSC